METIQSNPHKFLCSQITFSGKQSERIDSLQVRGEHKASIYKNYPFPACRFILTVHELTNTNIDKLEAKCTKFLKSRVGLPRCAIPGVLYIPLFTDIPTIRYLYLQSHATAHASSHSKADDKVNTALDSKVEHEEVWQRKFSTVIYCENKQKHVTDTIDITVQNLPKFKKTITKSIKEEINDTWMSHIKTLLCQCHFFQA